MTASGISGLLPVAIGIGAGVASGMLARDAVGAFTGGGEMNSLPAVALLSTSLVAGAMVPGSMGTIGASIGVGAAIGGALALLMGSGSEQSVRRMGSLDRDAAIGPKVDAEAGAGGLMPGKDDPGARMAKPGWSDPGAGGMGELGPTEKPGAGDAIPGYGLPPEPGQPDYTRPPWNTLPDGAELPPMPDRLPPGSDTGIEDPGPGRRYDNWGPPPGAGEPPMPPYLPPNGGRPLDEPVPGGGWREYPQPFREGVDGYEQPRMGPGGTREWKFEGSDPDPGIWLDEPIYDVDPGIWMDAPTYDPDPGIWIEGTPPAARHEG